MSRFITQIVLCMFLAQAQRPAATRLRAGTLCQRPRSSPATSSASGALAETLAGAPAAAPSPEPACRQQPPGEAPDAAPGTGPAYEGKETIRSGVLGSGSGREEPACRAGSGGRKRRQRTAAAAATAAALSVGRGGAAAGRAPKRLRSVPAACTDPAPGSKRAPKRATPAAVQHAAKRRNGQRAGFEERGAAGRGAHPGVSSDSNSGVDVPVSLHLARSAYLQAQLAAGAHSSSQPHCHARNKLVLRLYAPGWEGPAIIFHEHFVPLLATGMCASDRIERLSFFSSAGSAVTESVSLFGLSGCTFGTHMHVCICHWQPRTCPTAAAAA